MRVRMGNLRLGCVMFTLIGFVYACEPVHAQEYDFARPVDSFDLDSSDDFFTQADQELRGKHVILEFDRPTEVGLAAISNPDQVPFGGFAVMPLNTARTEWMVASRHYPPFGQRIDVIEAKDYVIVLSAFGESSGYALLLRPQGSARLDDAVAGDSENDFVVLAPRADRKFTSIPEGSSESVLRRVWRFGEEIEVVFSREQLEHLFWLLQQVSFPERPGTTPPGSGPIDPDGGGGIASIVCCTQNSVCSTYSGTECPAGTAQVTCACPRSE